MPNEAVFPMMLRVSLYVAAGGGVIAALSFLLARRGDKRLFTPVGPPCAKWNGFGVLGAFAIFVLVDFFIQSFLNSVGFYQWIYGPDFPKPPLTPNATAREKEAQAIRTLWAAAFGFVFKLGLVVSLVRRQGGPNPVHFRGVGMNIASGYLTWLLLTPAAFSVFALANMALAKFTGQEPDKHPLTLLGESAGNWEWTLLILQTVFLAPVLEELVFRGVLLPWLAQKDRPQTRTEYTVPPLLRARAMILLAASIAFAFHFDECYQAVKQHDLRAAILHTIPTIFMLLILPVYWLLPRWQWLRKHLRVRSTQQGRAIVASSALFAAFHASVWPSPVPLFVLAMGLGYLAIRTRSLVGPVVVHGLFNAISALYLVRVSGIG